MMNRRGNSLVGVIVAMGLGAMISVSIFSMLGDMMKSQKFVEQKNAMLYMHNDIYNLVSKKSSCTKTFETQTLDTVVGKTVAIKEIYNEANIVAFEDYSIKKKTYENGNIYIKSMKLSDYAAAPLTGTERYNGRAKLTIEYKKIAQSLGAETITKTMTVRMEFYRDKAHGGLIDDNGKNKKLASCSSEGAINTNDLQIAIAARTGVALSSVACTEKFRKKDWDGDPGCPDSDGDKVCDDSKPSGGGHFMKVPHPFSKPTSSHYATFKRSIDPPSGTVPALSGNEGRCWVSIKDKPTGTDSDGIFFLYNGTANDGLGCRRENGWVMSSCSLNNWGVGGDGDVNVIRDASGNQICYTNDYTQPVSDYAWDIKQVAMTVSCIRIMNK